MILLMKKDNAIIRGIHETDVYKILMMYFIWTYYPNMRVKFAFINRSRHINLAKLIDLGALNEELTAVSQMQFTEASITMFRNWGMFDPRFLQALSHLRLTPPNVWIEHDELHIEATGTWFTQTLWEIYVLAIVSELYGRAMMQQLGMSWNDVERGCLDRLDEKITLFSDSPDFRLMQFGLRRRHSGRIEELVTEQLVTRLPQGMLTGISNVHMAEKFNIEAQGTNAHELPMALVALARHTNDSAVRNAPYEVLRKWQALFGYKALIILDDAFGSYNFRRLLPRDLLESYRGFRHDSDDPYVYGDHTLRIYREHDIDPRTKMLVFSDGLKARQAVSLHKHFSPDIETRCAIGTGLTFDIPGIQAPSLVMKLVEAAGNPAVKLSNAPGKEIGSADEVCEIKRIFGRNLLPN